MDVSSHGAIRNGVVSFNDSTLQHEDNELKLRRNVYGMRKPKSYQNYEYDKRPTNKGDIQKQTIRQRNTDHNRKIINAKVKNIIEIARSGENFYKR